MTQVKLVTKTPDAENLIVYMARVSNPANQQKPEGSERLIKYLLKHKHWSPFEMCHLVLEINTTRSIAQQILRHRSFSFQEFSQRYADVKDLGYPIVPHLRRQDKFNRQNSIDDLPWDVTQKFYRRISKLFEDSQDLYREMVSLPLATPSRLYMAGSLRSWIHYIDLRTDNGTQWEHIKIALEAKKIFKQEFPMISKALDWSKDVT
jgi:thymidylate synthase (FAD)